MINSFSFPSLMNSATTGYVFDDSMGNLWEQSIGSRGRYLAAWAGKFETYGDGRVQHSPEVLAREEDFVDYLASLAAAALDDVELRRALISKMLAPFDRQRIAFYATMKFDENKTRWYSKSDLKISGSKSKANDRRWEEIPSWADGSVSAIFSLCQNGFSGLIAAYAGYKQVLDYLEENGGGYMGTAAKFLKLADDYRTESKMATAFSAVQDLATSQRLMDHAKDSIERMIDNINAQNAARAEATDTADAEAVTA